MLSSLRELRSNVYVTLLRAFCDIYCWYCAACPMESMQWEDRWSPISHFSQLPGKVQVQTLNGNQKVPHTKGNAVLLSCKGFHLP